MGSWRRVGAFLGLVPEDERPYDEADEYGEDGAPVRERYRSDDYADADGESHGGYDDYPEPSYAPRGRGRGGAEPVTQGALAVQAYPEARRDVEMAAGIRPVTVKLSGFAEARVIGERYRDGQSVILDMTEMDDSDARRLVDFAAGLAFALHGCIDKVATKVFMLLPPDVDVTADDRLAYAGRYGR